MIIIHYYTYIILYKLLGTLVKKNVAIKNDRSSSTKCASNLGAWSKDGASKLVSVIQFNQ